MDNYFCTYLLNEKSSTYQSGTILICRSEEDDMIIAEFTCNIHELTLNYRDPLYRNRHLLTFDDKKKLWNEFMRKMQANETANLYFCDENNAIMEINYESDVNMVRIHKCTVSIYLVVNDAFINALLQV